MLPEKKTLYKKAYVELYELISVLPKQQYNRIPKDFINYVCEQKDENYSFKIDNAKPLLEQDYMLETRALIVKMYEKYLSDEDEKEFWNKYDKICNNIIEEEKKENFSIDNIFENKVENKNEEKLPQKKEEKNFFIKFWNFLKKLCKRNEKNE